MGYIWVSDFKSDDTIKIKETLETTTFILESEIANYLLMKQLTVLSKIDLLTGVCNRNEMNNYVKKLADSNIEKSFGLFFLDINGLKHVNDELGHLEGDKLIKRAVTALKSIYKDIPIYRAGGDEFVIIIEDATQELLDHYKEEVKEKAKDFDVSFAVGYYIINNSKQIYKALKLADEAMYIDKKKYYDNR
jgi:diguanylate cyclase (GGDEF)-like protein